MNVLLEYFDIAGFLESTDLVNIVQNFKRIIAKIKSNNLPQLPSTNFSDFRYEVFPIVLTYVPQHFC